VTESDATFALRVRGESMIGAHILPGDYAVFEKREARDGDIVAALIDGETTLKRFILKDGEAFLKAENPEFTDLQPVSELLVQGVLVGLVRSTRR
jgi:repressor LexA